MTYLFLCIIFLHDGDSPEYGPISYVRLFGFDVTDFLVLDTWAPIRSKKILTMMTENENT